MKKMRIIIVLICMIGLCSSNADAQCTPKKVSKTYMSICPGDIKAEKKKVLLVTKSVPKKVDGKSEIHITHYYVIDKSKHSTDQDFLDYANTLKELEMHQLLINGREFTGVLKIATRFENGGENHDQTGYNILKLEYQDGKLVKTTKLEDIELEKETPVSR